MATKKTAMTDADAKKAHSKCVRAFTRTAGAWGKDGAVAAVRGQHRGRKWIQHFLHSDADVLVYTEQPSANPDVDAEVTVGFALMLGPDTSPRSDFKAAVTAVVDAANATLKVKGLRGTRVRKSATKVVVTTTVDADAIANPKSAVMRFLAEAGKGMNTALKSTKPGKPKKEAYAVDYIPDASGNNAPAVAQLRALIADVMEKMPPSAGYAYPYALADRVFRQMSNGMIRNLRAEVGDEPVYDIVVRECERIQRG